MLTMGVNVAVTDLLAASRVTEQVPLPVHPLPDHPANVWVESGVAVSVAGPELGAIRIDSGDVGPLARGQSRRNFG